MYVRCHFLLFFIGLLWNFIVTKDLVENSHGVVLIPLYFYCFIISMVCVKISPDQMCIFVEFENSIETT
jgi:hypothetical protein